MSVNQEQAVGLGKNLDRPTVVEMTGDVVPASLQLPVVDKACKESAERTGILPVLNNAERLDAKLGIVDGKLAVSQAEKVAPRAFLTKVVDFFIPNKLSMAITAGYFGPGMAAIYLQMSTAMCWRCYVFRVLPTVGIVFGGYIAGLLGVKIANPIKHLSAPFKFVGKLFSQSRNIENTESQDGEN